jgi:hypothetical protein
MGAPAQRRADSLTEAIEIEREASPQAGVLHRFLAAADRLHAAPGLPAVPLRFADGHDDVGGYSHRAAVPVAIDISPATFSLLLTGAHEIGHFVDHQLLGRGRFASESDTAVAAWRDAVRRSEDRTRREAVCAGASNLTAAQVDYLLSYREEFARSYAQWVLCRSADRELLAGLDEAVAFERSASHVRFTFEPAEFEPIASALDAVFGANEVA